MNGGLVIPPPFFEDLINHKGYRIFMSEVGIGIIGRAGFVGSRLSMRFDRIGRKYLVCDINTEDRSDNIIYLDVEDEKSLDQLGGFKCIINLAAVHRDDVRPLTRYDDVNVQGAINVCTAARKYSVNKIVFTSSVAIYGFNRNSVDYRFERYFRSIRSYHLQWATYGRRRPGCAKYHTLDVNAMPCAALSTKKARSTATPTPNPSTRKISGAHGRQESAHLASGSTNASAALAISRAPSLVG